MPQGVEHSCLPSYRPARHRVRIPLMPQGVEHLGPCLAASSSMGEGPRVAVFAMLEL